MEHLDEVVDLGRLITPQKSLDFLLFPKDLGNVERQTVSPFNAVAKGPGFSLPPDAMSASASTFGASAIG